jgi:hypothetical protein
MMDFQFYVEYVNVSSTSADRPKGDFLFSVTWVIETGGSQTQ